MITEKKLTKKNNNNNVCGRDEFYNENRVRLPAGRPPGGSSASYKIECGGGGR